MAEDQLGAHKDHQRDTYLWTRVFGTFKVALDPKKLLLAGAGIVVMAFGWWLWSALFWAPRSAPDLKDYPLADYKPSESYSDDPKVREQKAQDDRDNAFAADQRKYRLLEQTAGPGGTMRTWPWFENRGPNPFLVLERAVAARTRDDAAQRSGERDGRLLESKQFLVLIEPLQKFLTPVVYLFHPDGGFWNRIYFFLIILWTLATWALFGAAISRMAAVQFARNEKVGMTEAVRFAWSKYVSFFSAPLFPLVLVAVLSLFLIIFDFFQALTWAFGDIIIAGLFFPIVILFGLVMAVVLVGLVGWPLMYSTISAEGSDSFDALSRSYSYVYQAPWHYLWYGFVAIVYGAALVFFVGLIGSLTVYLGKWAMSQNPLARTLDREPDYLFVYAPTSFHWRELLLEGGPAVYSFRDQEKVATQVDKQLRLAEAKIDAQIDPDKLPKGKKLAEVLAEAEQKKKDLIEKANQEKNEVKEGQIKTSYYSQLKPWNKIGAVMVAFWLYLVFLLVVGFGYSYFWSASAIIYLLMRRKVDDTDLDEVHLEEEDMEEPYTPPAPATTPGTPVKPAGSPNLIPPESLTMRPATGPTSADTGLASPKEATPEPPRPASGDVGPHSTSAPPADGGKIHGPTGAGGGS